MPKDPLLSVVVISFNTKEITLNCLKSLFQFVKKTPFEVIVFDNASHDGSYKALKEFAKDKSNLKLIESKENLGFGGGNNLAALQAKGKYLLFLNSDTILFEDCVTPMIEELEKDHQLGIISCRLLNKDKSVQPNGGFFPTPSRVAAWQLFIDDLPFAETLIKSVHPKPFRKEHVYLDWVTGAFLMCPREIFLKVNGFDTKIFMYAEELELCYRIKALGVKVLLDQCYSIIHLGRASAGNTMALTEEVKGLLYFYTKHQPKDLGLIKKYFYLGALLRYLLFGIIRNNGEARKVYSEVVRYTH